MLFPWATIRAISAKIFIKADRAVRSAPVGPPGSGTGLTDEEEQAIHVVGSVEDPVKENVKEQISIFTVLKIATVLSALYTGGSLWFGAHRHYNHDDFMCPRLVVCASTLVEMILLTGSRFTAGLIFPGLVISMFSKCYATRSFLHHSWLGAVIDLEPSHDIHTYFGYLTLVASLVHGILHAARYMYANMAYIMYETDAGRSGLIASFLLLPIVLPMKFEFFRNKMSFQFRKSLHMLFLPMTIALCFHSVVFRYVGSILVVWYTLDRVYFTTIQTFLIDHPVFEAVGRGTMVALDLPAGYEFKAGSYIYVNSPMISRSEWHPFSIIQVPGSPPRATFYAEAVGDWTKELFRLGLEQDRLPLWITAAQPSLMETAIYYDNIVLVCTGAGITPAVSIIERYTKRKNLHLLWMSRDGGMVALFEEQLRKVHSTVHLTGKPAEETKVALHSLLDPSATSAVNANHGMSFTSSAISMSKHNHLDDDFEDSMSVNDDTNDVESIPPTPRLLSNLLRRQRNSLRRNNHREPAKPCTRDPVKLVFGRPNIGTYLAQTFAVKIAPPCTQHDNGDVDAGDSWSSEGSVSSMDADTSNVALEGERSTRLSADQMVSKKTLMKADPTILEDEENQRGKQTHGEGSNGSLSPSSSSSSSPGRPLRWLVLYCGANAQVEEAIAKKCDELRVNWQKEYFGAW